MSVSAPSPGLSPQKDLTVNNFSFRIGFTPSTYSVYIWSMDEANNISALTAAGSGTLGTDKATIDYQPAPPPVVINGLIYKGSTPTKPLSQADQMATAGEQVTIKWKATSTNFGLTPISLYYTLDDVTYTSIAENLANGANGSCTPDEAGLDVDDGATGCYLWTSPRSSYYKVRVTAKDNVGSASFSPTNPMNVSGTLNMLAGNTEPGLGASATSAMFFNDLGSSAVEDPQTLVVTSKGDIYFRDIYRGILHVDPNSGVLTKFIPTTGTSSGDGGLAINATLGKPFKIVLDFSENLIIWDNDRIRKVDFSSGMISTILGGGAVTTAGVPPLQVKLESPGSNLKNFYSLWPAPNGDLYLTYNSYVGAPPDGGYKILKLDTQNNMTSLISPNGTGLSDSFPNQDITKCRGTGFSLAFDPAQPTVQYLYLNMFTNSGTPLCANTNLVKLDVTTGTSMTPLMPFSNQVYSSSSPTTGRDGKFYGVNRNKGIIFTYDQNLNVWKTLVGIAGQQGYCSDGTLATACAIDPQDVFVTGQGKIYFVDKGRIRTVQDDNTIRTIAGQSYSFGDGGLATSARFNFIGNIDQWQSVGQTKIVLIDTFDFRFREFVPGQNISTVAGTGINSTFNVANSAQTESIFISSSGTSFDDFKVDEVNGDIYFQNGGLIRLKRSTGYWEKLAGFGSTPYYDPSADGVVGASIGIPSYPMRILGLNNSKVLALMGWYDGVNVRDNLLKIFDGNDSYRMTHLLGKKDYPSAYWCADGTAPDQCALPDVYGYLNYSRATYDSFEPGGRWIMNRIGTAQIRIVNPATPIATLETLAHGAIAFAYRHDATHNIIYYCSSTDGKLHRFDMNQPSGSRDTVLNWPIASMQCSQTTRSLLYNPNRNSIIFAYKQNNLMGIAEYLNP